MNQQAHRRLTPQRDEDCESQLGHKGAPCDHLGLKGEGRHSLGFCKIPVEAASLPETKKASPYSGWAFF